MANAAEETPDAVSDDPESRVNRFMRSALSILAETGRTDFTVLEVVERSKTSLRSFYQHFSTKDELLLALIDPIMTESTEQWREDTDDLPAAEAIRVLIDRICTPAESTKQDSINRGLTFYNDHLAETLPREYARVLSPLHDLIREIIERGIAEGVFRADVESPPPPRSSCSPCSARCGCAASAPNSTAFRSRPSTSTTSACAGCSPALPIERFAQVEAARKLPGNRGCLACSMRGNVITATDRMPLSRRRTCRHASFPTRCSTPTTTSTSPRKR